MNVRKHEILEVTADDSTPKAIIDALLEMRPDVHLEAVDISDRYDNWQGHRVTHQPVTFTFRTGVTNE